MKKSLLVASVAALSLSASLAHADEALGTEGRLSVSTQVDVFRYTSVKDAAGNSTSLTVVGPEMRALPALALDYWVTKDFTVGGALQYASGDNKSGFQIAPVVGYRYAMGDATLWPKLAPAYGSTTVTNAGKDTKSSKFTLGVEVPYLWTRGAFFHGPALNVSFDLSSKVGDNDGDKNTTFGLSYKVGGTF